MAVTPYSLRRLIMRANEGDIGYSSFAAISKHVTDKVDRHGASYLFSERWTKYLSARLTARYSVSIAYSLRACNCSISITICCRLKLVIYKGVFIFEM